jgi:membrane protease subunit (stomatin/prohibitin family)
MNMAGNLRDYTQYQAAQAIPIAAANEGGGGAGLGAGLGAGMALGKAMTDALNQTATGGDAAQKSSPASPTQLPITARPRPKGRSSATIAASRSRAPRSSARVWCGQG